jgi:hypothetical protein
MLYLQKGGNFPISILLLVVVVECKTPFMFPLTDALNLYLPLSSPVHKEPKGMMTSFYQKP